MDTFFKTKDQRLLDEEIARLIETLSHLEATDEDYSKISAQLKVLCEAREKKNPRAINTDTLLGIGANLIGLIIILNFEKTGVITSKALSFLWKK